MKNNIREAGTPPRWGCLTAGLESPGAPTVRQQGTPARGSAVHGITFFQLTPGMYGGIKVV
jgi:hypothetical protein